MDELIRLFSFGSLSGQSKHTSNWFVQRKDMRLLTAKSIRVINRINYYSQTEGVALKDIFINLDSNNLKIQQFFATLKSLKIRKSSNIIPGLTDFLSRDGKHIDNQILFDLVEASKINSYLQSFTKRKRKSGTQVPQIYLNLSSENKEEKQNPTVLA